jgi:AraC-like DNA-binding protein
MMVALTGFQIRLEDNLEKAHRIVIYSGFECNMTTIQFEILPTPDALKNDLECFRVGTYTGSEEVAVRVCPNGFPGIVFQHHDGKSVIKNIVTDAGRTIQVPTLFAYGQVTVVSTMYFAAPFSTIQAIFKPHAQKTLFGMDASALTNNSMGSQSFGAEELNNKLIEAESDAELAALLSDFLAAKREQANVRDVLIEEGLLFIGQHIAAVSIESLREHLHLSERQLEKRFNQTVGIPPQLYIRIRRVNEAFRLMDSGKYERLVDIAYELNFYDQSHFIRDIKAFSGLTPKGITQRVDDFHHDLAGSSYMYR